MWGRGDPREQRFGVDDTDIRERLSTQKTGLYFSDHGTWFQASELWAGLWNLQHPELHLRPGGICLVHILPGILRQTGVGNRPWRKLSGPGVCAAGEGQFCFSQQPFLITVPRSEALIYLCNGLFL